MNYTHCSVDKGKNNVFLTDLANPFRIFHFFVCNVSSCGIKYPVVLQNSVYFQVIGSHTVGININRAGADCIFKKSVPLL